MNGWLECVSHDFKLEQMVSALKWNEQKQHNTTISYRVYEASSKRWFVISEHKH